MIIFVINHKIKWQKTHNNYWSIWLFIKNPVISRRLYL